MCGCALREPNQQLEQYPTGAHLAACVIHTAAARGDIEDRTVVDLGVGGAVLTIASLLMGAVGPCIYCPLPSTTRILDAVNDTHPMTMRSSLGHTDSAPVLARPSGAAHVTGVDVDPAAITLARVGTDG